MGPGDNIAYKLGAAATKKNQELCFSSYNRNMSLVLSKFAQQIFRLGLFALKIC